jgi:hypothetical protein
VAAKLLAGPARVFGMAQEVAPDQLGRLPGVGPLGGGPDGAIGIIDQRIDEQRMLTKKRRQWGFGTGIESLHGRFLGQLAQVGNDLVEGHGQSLMHGLGQSSLGLDQLVGQGAAHLPGGENPQQQHCSEQNDGQQKQNLMADLPEGNTHDDLQSSLLILVEVVFPEIESGLGDKDPAEGEQGNQIGNGHQTVGDIGERPDHRQRRETYDHDPHDPAHPIGLGMAVPMNL